MRSLLRLYAMRTALALFVACVTSGAQARAPDEPITLGQSAVLTGPLSQTVLSFNQAAEALFNTVNAKGGVHGRPIRLVSLDDELKPEKAAANYRKLIADEKVFALFGGVGTGTVAAGLPILEQERVPMIAGFLVGDSVRERAGRNAYWVRAGYAEESERIIRHMVTVGIKEIGAVSLDNPGGREVLKNIEQQLTAHGLKLKVTALASLNGSNVTDTVKSVAAAAPQGLIVFLGGALAGQFAKQLLDAGARPQIFGMSTVPGEVLAKMLGERARGIAISQVTIYPWDATIPVVREYQALARAANLPLSYLGLEGYLSAKLVVEALRKAGKDPTREKLRNALESGDIDLGGFLLTYAQNRHSGSNFVEMVMLTREGRYSR